MIEGMDFNQCVSNLACEMYGNHSNISLESHEKFIGTILARGVMDEEKLREWYRDNGCLLNQKNISRMTYIQ